MGRSLSRALCLAGGLLTAGCADHGSYHFSWLFPGYEPAEVGCGLHGVDSIRVTGMNTDGEGEDVTTLCARGAFAHSVPVGTWTLTVHQIDVRGVPILLRDAQDQLLPDPTATVTITKDADTPLESLPIVLLPRPACSDGVDNDRDGRVDLDDPGCGASKTATTE
jgi:hypothetical protein